MSKKAIFQILILVLLQACCATHKAQVQNQDLDFIYKTIIDNHPGIYNDQDPGFKNHLDKEYKKASRLLARNSAPEKETQIMKDFAASFNDAHLWIHYFDDKKISPNKPENQKNFEVKNFNKEVVWITLPTFDLDKNQQKQFDLVLKVLPKMRGSVIVFDLRGNQGGNTEYGSRITNRLWGEKYADLRRYETRSEVFVDWRASEDNLMHVSNMYDRYKALWMRDIVDGLKLAIKERRPYYREEASVLKKRDKIHQHHLTQDKIIVIIDSGNFSAALDFIDQLKIMSSEVTLVGQQTKADRLYMEVRSVQLPSGLGSFALPIKVYRNRPRGDNVPYKPDFEYDVKDDKRLKQFVMKMISER